MIFFSDYFWRIYLLHTNCVHIAGHFVWNSPPERLHCDSRADSYLWSIIVPQQVMQEISESTITIYHLNSGILGSCFLIDFRLRGYQLVRWMTRCGFAGPLIVKVAPPASLMVALAGLGFTYLGIGQIIASLLQLKLHLKHHCHCHFMVNPYQTSNKLAGFIRFHWGFMTTRNAVTKRDC